MSTALQSVLAAAMALPDAGRELLAHQLLETLIPKNGADNASA